MSQSAYAKRIGVHKRTVSRWEWGAYTVPSAAMASLLLMEGAGPPDELPKRGRRVAQREE